MIVKKFELYFKNVISGRKKGLIPFFVKLLLLPISWIYGLVVHGRNWLYDQGWMRHYVPPVPLVVSVGNIVAGGTGKTPVALLLAGAFYERYALAILSRGYRSKAEKLDTPILLCDGQGPIFPASYCGDEAFLFARRFPKSIVIVGGNRKKASFLAAKAGAEIILLDDGLQHRRLARDFDVVVVDAGDPFGQGYFLPRGFLRDEIRSLARASIVVLNHIKNPHQFDCIKSELREYTDCPIIGTCGYVEAYRDLKGQEVEIPKGSSIGMFCAIAHPEYFQKLLEEEQLEVNAEYILPDHDEIKEKKLEQFAQTCLKKGMKWLVCTEKDRAKLPDHLTLSLPIVWVQMELRIVNGKEEWDSFLNQAELKIR